MEEPLLASSSASPSWLARNKWHILTAIAAVIVTVAITVPVSIVTTTNNLQGSTSALSDGEALCNSARPSAPARAATNKELGTVSSPRYLIRNANALYTGYGVLYNADIIIANGTIEQVGVGLVDPTPGVTIVIDATNKYITPGLVDLHSHVGVYATPELQATQDGNEATNPTFPQVRSIDGYNPTDGAIQRILGGGITTSLVLPGSANTMGGEAFAIKHRGSRVSDAQIADAPRYMKMACGENPKNVYGGAGQTPASRMGSAWVMRAKFEEARNLVTAQNDWCTAPNANSRYPTTLALDSLTALLRGSLVLHTHCYTVWDMEMMIRLSDEFAFNITAFHHAIEAWKIGDVLRDRNIVTATFADHWGFKVEAYDGTPYAPIYLNDVGARVVLKSDHPVLPAETLMYEAAKATAYGLDRLVAISAVTSEPAKAMYLDHKLGSLEVGLDADVVLWDRDPMIVGALPDLVFLDGAVAVNRSLTANTETFPSTPTMTVSPIATCSNNQTVQVASYQIVNAVVWAGNPPTPSASCVTVINGVVTDLQSGTTACAPADVTFNAQGGHVMAGGVLVGSELGLVEIEQEVQTQDGIANADLTTLASLSAADGILLGGLQLYSAWAGGVTVAISPPLSYSLVMGKSAGFYTGVGVDGTECGLHTSVAEDALLNVTTIDRALHISLGYNVRDGSLVGSNAGQITQLRQLLGTDAAPWTSVTDGTLPLIVAVDQADIIASVLRVLDTYPNIRMSIIGGAEAHLVADRIAARNVPVILRPVHCFPDSWEKRRCSDDSVGILKQAGVTLAVAPMNSVDQSRSLRWEAGLAYANGLTATEAVAAMTTIPAQIFGVGSVVGEITTGYAANLVVFNGTPFALSSTPQLVAIGEQLRCWPRQRGFPLAQS